MIPLSDKDAEDLQRWNNEQEDRRRQTSIQGKSRPPRVPSLGALDRMMRERPLGAGKSKAQMAMGKVPEAVVRVQDARTGEWVDRPVLRGEKPKPGVVSSIKFIEGNVYVNGDFAPELTNDLKSIIKGALKPISSGENTGGGPGKDVYGKPVFLDPPTDKPRIGGTFQEFWGISNGVRITPSLLRTYINQLQKQSGQRGTLLPTKIEFGQELYDSLFSAEGDTVSDPTKREPKVINVRKLSKNLPEDQKFTKTDLPKNAVYVGRNYTKGKYQLQGTPWGNPYRVGPDGNLDQVLEKYEGWARTQLSKNPNWLQPLIGKDLVDWCEPGKCHADVLKKLIKEQVGEFERTPLTGKSQLSDIDEMRERFNELDAKKKRGGTERLTKGEAKEYNRLKEMIRKAITVDPEAAEMPEESPTKVRVSDPEKFQQMRKRFNELDAIMKTKGLAGAELAEYNRLDQEIKSIRTESTQRVDGTSDKPGEIVSAKKKPEVKVTVKNIGSTKAPGIYADGKYAPQVTYAVVQAMVKAKENKSFWQTLSRQGGIRVGKVFVSVEDMQRLAKAIPADTEVVYNKQGKPVVKPRTTSGGAFGIAGKTLNTLGIVGAIGDILRLSKEWTEMGKRKVPIT